MIPEIFSTEEDTDVCLTRLTSATPFLIESGSVKQSVQIFLTDDSPPLYTDCLLVIMWLQ